MSFELFGLTGGLASGKSTVAARFRARGVAVIDADQLAREVVAPNSEGLARVVEAFGSEVLDESGSLDRARLGAIVFGDDTKRRELNAIVHPLIARLTAERASELARAGARVACYEAALLVENGLADAFRPLVVVAASKDAQVARAIVRDGLAEDEARARLAAQLPLADKIRVADYVIENDGDRASLERRADEVLDAILAKAPR